MEKNTWTVISNESVNGIKFGTNRKEIRKIFGKPKRVFKKTQSSVNTTDAYPSFHVYYSADDKFEAIELFDKSINVLVDSHLIFPGTLEAIRAAIPDLAGEYGSYISKKQSVGIYVEEDDIDSILIGRKDYYNQSVKAQAENQ